MIPAPSCGRSSVMAHLPVVADDVNLSDLEECRAVAKKSEVVAQAIVHDIVREGLQPGDRLASEAEMMEQYDVGRGSLRRRFACSSSTGW